MQNSALLTALYALDTISLEYRVNLIPEDAAEFFRASEPYNDMKGMETLIADIDRLIPGSEYGKPNHRYSVGNEGSRVLYVKIVTAYLIGTPWRKDRFLERVAAIAAAHGADEYWLTTDDGYQLKYRISSDLIKKPPRSPKASSPKSPPASLNS